MQLLDILDIIDNVHVIYDFCQLSLLDSIMSWNSWAEWNIIKHYNWQCKHVATGIGIYSEALSAQPRPNKTDLSRL